MSKIICDFLTCNCLKNEEENRTNKEGIQNPGLEADGIDDNSDFEKTDVENQIKSKESEQRINLNPVEKQKREFKRCEREMVAFESKLQKSKRRNRKFNRFHMGDHLMQLRGEAFIGALERLRREDLTTAMSNKEDFKARGSILMVEDLYQEFLCVSVEMLRSIDHLLKLEELPDGDRVEFETAQRFYEDTVKRYLVMRNDS